jgi:uncharacterized membrane protein
MLVTTHGLLGALIGKEVGFPPLAFLLGFISHFLLDSIPHCDGPDDVAGRDENDPNTKAQYALVSFDLLLSLIIVIYFLNVKLATPAMIWGAIGALLPDLIDNVPLWKKKIRKLAFFKDFHAFHAKIQSIKTSLWFGLSIQYALAIFFFCLIYLL